jgi:hypothetical protein
VEDNVSDDVEDEVVDSVEDEVSDDVEDNVSDDVEDEVVDRVEGEVSDNMKDEVPSDKKEDVSDGGKGDVSGDGEKELALNKENGVCHDQHLCGSIEYQPLKQSLKGWPFQEFLPPSVDWKLEGEGVNVCTTDDRIRKSTMPSGFPPVTLKKLLSTLLCTKETTVYNG